jgi:hypothetical protein
MAIFDSANYNPSEPSYPQMGLRVGGGLFKKPKPVSNPLTDQYKVYNTGVQQQAGDYSNIMDEYKKLLDLSKTGGYSDTDIANIRERSISPIRSVYAGANRDVDRQRALQGGYSPNYAAVKAKMAREQSDVIGNQTTNINADLAQRIAQNKLSSIPQAISGMTSLYGTTPALSSLYGNQALQGAQLQEQIKQRKSQQGLDTISRLMSGFG